MKVTFEFESSEERKEAIAVLASMVGTRKNAKSLLNGTLSTTNGQVDGEELLPEQSNDLEIEITGILHTIGMPVHIQGFRYVRTAIMLATEDCSILKFVTKKLYPTVAQKHDTTRHRVERAIRHAIGVTFTRGNVQTINKLFGYTYSDGKGKPTNSEFIALISDNIKTGFFK